MPRRSGPCMDCARPTTMVNADGTYGPCHVCIQRPLRDLNRQQRQLVEATEKKADRLKHVVENATAQQKASLIALAKQGSELEKILEMTGQLEKTAGGLGLKLDLDKVKKAIITDAAREYYSKHPALSTASDWSKYEKSVNIDPDTFAALHIAAEKEDAAEAAKLAEMLKQAEKERKAAEKAEKKEQERARKEKAQRDAALQRALSPDELELLQMARHMKENGKTPDQIMAALNTVPPSPRRSPPPSPPQSPPQDPFRQPSQTDLEAMRREQGEKRKHDEQEEPLTRRNKLRPTPPTSTATTPREEDREPPFTPDMSREQVLHVSQEIRAQDEVVVDLTQEEDNIEEDNASGNESDMTRLYNSIADVAHAVAHPIETIQNIVSRRGSRNNTDTEAPIKQEKS